MKKLLLILAVCFPFLSVAHGFDEYEMNIEAKGIQLSGTLTMPAHAHNAVPLVIIIAGSGPTDRNCNGQGFKTNAYQKMASQFALNGFNNMILDAKAIISKFETDARFSKLTICGHSEGSLVGMMSVNEKHQYISLAGVGESANEVLKKQLKGKLGPMEPAAFSKLDSLKAGRDIVCDMPALNSIFRPSVLPYLKSWFKIDPSQEIKKLKGPVLIINGTKDLQVAEENALTLSKACTQAKLLIVPNMNHCLTEIASDKQEDNLASYNVPELPLSKKMMDEIILFIVK
jgi:pimeloyl-ACP methyl ester carboxylesterase